MMANEIQLTFLEVEEMPAIHINTPEEEPEETEDDMYFEKMYTKEEEQQVIWELNKGLNLKEISKNVTKRQLKNWFANLCMSYRGEVYGDITGQDLYDIAEKIGFKLEG